MPFGTLTELWQKLTTLEKSDQARQWTAEKSAQAPRAENVLQVHRDFQTVSAPSTQGDNWFWDRNRAEDPGNHPDYTLLRRIGMNGILTSAEDPLLAWALDYDRSNGFKAGVWWNPHAGANADAVIARMKELVGGLAVDAVAWDVEAEAKGWPGSDQWEFMNQLAALAKQAFPDAQFIVAPPPLGLIGGKSDYNYGAWASLGAIIQVQTYGADPMKDLFDPVIVVNSVHANGVPYAQIAVCISPLQLPTAPGPLHELGIFSISVWTADGLTPEVVAAATPFLAPVPVSGSLLTPVDAPRAESSGEVPIVVISPQGEIEEVVRVENAAAFAVADEQVDTLSWQVDESVSIDEPSLPDEEVRTLQGATVASKGPFPSWCLRAVGGYVQGVNGPISAGLRQLELLIGVSHVHDDYATHGHATHSFHYCGLAMDVDNTRNIWDYLFPNVRETLELFGPWGLYKRGVKFSDKALQDAHYNHIHIALNKTADGISTLWPKTLAGQTHVPGGAHPAPIPVTATVKVTPTLPAAWNHLSDALAKDVPKSINRVANAKRKLHSFLT